MMQKAFDDRIICNLAMLISQYHGVNKNMASLQATHSKENGAKPIHGTGQGSCASPAIWLLISSILVDCLSELGRGMTMIDVNKTNSIQQWIDGFVDDTSLFTNIIRRTNNNNIIQLCNHLTYDMTIWNELLEASGGKLELSKCFYYVLSWKFDKEGNGLPMSIAEQRAQHIVPIVMTESNNPSISILQKEVNEAHKTLGCYKAIDGNEDAQIKNMAYKAIYIPSMRYGLPACFLSLEAIDDIQKSTLEKFLPFMGYDHGFPRALSHGPLKMGGCEIPHFFTEIMGLKVESKIAHIGSNSVLGKSIRININYIQLICGLEHPLFSSRDDIGYVDSNWITHLRTYII
jgi:hypothetical protein